MVTVAAAIAVVPLFCLGRHWERSARPERYVALVATVLLVECLLYPMQPNVPVGVFRIPLLGGDLRTVDFIIAVGILARISVRPLPRRVSGSGVVWFLSFVWLTTAAVRGLVSGHDTNLVLFSFSSVIGLFGALLLVAGCEAPRLVGLLRSRFVVPLGLLVLVLLPNEASDDPTTYLGTDLGVIAVDTASLFVALGTFVLLVEWSSPARHRWAPWAAVPLLLTPFTIEQRATLIQLAATVLVVAWAMTRPAWRSQVRVPPVRFLWALMGTIAVIMVVLIVQLRDVDSPLPFAGYYADTFTAQSQAMSAQDRIDSFAVGVDEWSDAWAYGHGLGHTYEIPRTYGPPIHRLGWFDNASLDLLVRSGVIGLGLLSVALVCTLRDGLVAWRRHGDGMVAAFALAGVAVLTGLILKGAFESILEKGKIAVLIGLAAGAIASAARGVRTSTAPRNTPAIAGQQGATTWT